MKFTRLARFFKLAEESSSNVENIQQEHHQKAQKELDNTAMKIDQKLEEVKEDLDNVQDKVQEILDDEVMKSKEAKSKFRPNLRVF